MWLIREVVRFLLKIEIIAANMIVNKPSNSKVLSSQIIQPAGSLTSAGLFKIASVRSETVPNN